MRGWIKPKPMSHPVQALSEILSDDMAAMNATILNRMESQVPLVKDLAAYLIASGGKRIRPLLSLATTALYGGDMGRAQNLAACVEFIHTATLLHDDVVDESDERRGQKSANTVFGNQASVLVGDFLFSRSFQIMVEDGSLDVLRILSNASAIIAEGEVMQLTIQGQMDTSLDQYLQVVEAKTAALFSAACEIGPVIAGRTADGDSDGNKNGGNAMASYGMNLGIAFQIADDVLDYTAAHDKLGKTLGDDFREGKLTAPVIFALKNASPEEQKFWQRTLSDNTQNDGDLDQALEILKSHDAFTKAIDLAKTYGEKAHSDLDKAPDHAVKDHLAGLIDFSITRSH